MGDFAWPISPRNAQGVPLSRIGRRLGGNQIDYADETSRVRAMFSEALAKHDLKPRMDEVYQAERATLPPARVEG